MSSKVFRSIALVGFALVVISYIALPYLSFGGEIGWTGLGLLSLDGLALPSIQILGITIIAAALTVATLFTHNRIVRIAAFVAGAAIMLPLLLLYADFSSPSDLGDARTLLALGFWLTIVGAIIVAIGNGLALRRA